MNRQEVAKLRREMKNIKLVRVKWLELYNFKNPFREHRMYLIEDMFVNDSSEIEFKLKGYKEPIISHLSKSIFDKVNNIMVCVQNS